MNKIIPYGKQFISEQDIEAVNEVLTSDFLTQGPQIKVFEEAFAQHVGAEFAIAVSSGTAALHLNALALDVQPGDQVITSPITFAASANCVRYCGGEVLFADIDPTTYLLDIDSVEQLLEQDTENKIKGIIPVDFAGRSVDMEAFRSLANQHDCWIIEDACHAPGAFFENQAGEFVRAGSGRYADLSIFSFHPVKHIAAGEGGMITTNNQELYERILELRTHGITRDQDRFKNDLSLAYAEDISSFETFPGWYMEMQELGYNYRISDINCALGNSQLKRANENLLQRKKIAHRYYQAFESMHSITDRNLEAAIDQPASNGHAYHLYVIEAHQRAELYTHLRDHNIFCQIHYIPCHLMPYYQQFGWKSGDLPAAEKYYSKCISLPMFPTLTRAEQDFVIDCIRDFYGEA